MSDADGTVSGRLELTWANKDRRLLTHDDITYEWVDPSDWRVSETRLLDEVATHGTNPEDNLLIQGDALHALEALTSIPEYADRYLGKVRLCYIDPPFNTGQSFQQYDDSLEHSVWLTMLRDRLVQIHRLLADDGSVWVHLDDVEQHRARSVLDEVFGAENFVATVVWNHAVQSKSDNPYFSSHHNLITVYRKTAALNPFQMPRLPEHNKAYSNPDNDPKGLWRSGDTRSPNYRATLCYALPTPSGGAIPPPANGWRWKPETMRAKIATGEVVFVDDETRIVRKIYLADQKGRVPENIWFAKEVGTSRSAKAEMKALFGEDVFATPKPEALLERIIYLASSPGDIVLDCFAGSGTTAAVAHKMGRRWVTVELSGDTVGTFVRPRLKKVVAGSDPGGITDAVGWQGGGGFTEVKVAPSMFEQVGSNVVLSDWAVNGQLAEAVAAQLKFTREPSGPFVGRRGRTRLAVLDGMLTSGLAEHLVGHLGEQETLVVVAMAIEEGVAEHLRALRPGSRARKVPRDLARSGKIPPRLVRLGGATDGGVR